MSAASQTIRRIRRPQAGPTKPGERIVGRTSELARVEAAVRHGGRIVWIHGPAGVGKSTVLAALTRRWKRSGHDVRTVHARYVDPVPVAIREALGSNDGSGPRRLRSRRILVVDRFDHWERVSGWLRDALLPTLPDDVALVVASRRRPDAAWRAAPELRERPCIIGLRNFDEATTLEFLEGWEIDGPRAVEAHEVTAGHPLALALVAERLSACPDTSALDAGKAQDVVRALVSRFREAVPSSLHRRALELSSLVRLVDQPLLEAALDLEDGFEVFEWLRERSFVEASARGLSPHDEVRSALKHELRWRDPRGYRALRERAHAHLRDRMEQQREDGVFDPATMEDLTWMFMHEDDVMRRFAWRTDDSLWFDRADDADWEVAERRIATWEGTEAVRWLRYWREHQPEAGFVLRSADEPVAAFAVILTLRPGMGRLLEEDPAVAAFWQHLAPSRPLRDGQSAVYSRFWHASKTFQKVSAAQGSLWLHTIWRYAITPDVAVSAVSFRTLGFYLPAFRWIRFEHARGAAFHQEGHRYGVVLKDWRQQALGDWVDAMSRRTILPQRARRVAETTPVVALSEADFRAAVKDALIAYSRSVPPAGNPLLYSRLVTATAGAGADETGRWRALKTTLGDACDRLREHPKTLPLARALDRTYVRPTGTQEQAAERLGLPFGTYRRHLTRAIAAITDDAWRRETAR